MIDLVIKDIMDIVDGYLIGNYDIDNIDEKLKQKVNMVEVLSKGMKEGSIYAPIKGEKIDPHKFIPSLDDKALAVLTEESIDEILAVSGAEKLPDDKLYIKVQSNEKAVIDVSRYVRSKYTKPIVFLIRDVKGMQYERLHYRLSTFYRLENHNHTHSIMGFSHAAISLDDRETDVAFFKLQPFEPGIVKYFTEFIRPDIVIISGKINVYHEYYDTEEEKCRDLLDVANYMNDGGKILIHSDDETLLTMREELAIDAKCYKLDDMEEVIRDVMGLVRNKQNKE